CPADSAEQRSRHCPAPVCSMVALQATVVGQSRAASPCAGFLALAAWSEVSGERLYRPADRPPAGVSRQMTASRQGRRGRVLSGLSGRRRRALGSWLSMEPARSLRTPLGG